MSKGNKEGKKREKPGPDPERVKIEKRDWREAVKEALRKKKPKDGWPEESDG